MNQSRNVGFNLPEWLSNVVFITVLGCMCQHAFVIMFLFVEILIVCEIFIINYDIPRNCD